MEKVCKNRKRVTKNISIYKSNCVLKLTNCIGCNELEHFTNVKKIIITD